MLYIFYHIFIKNNVYRNVYNFTPKFSKMYYTRNKKNTNLIQISIPGAISYFPAS